MRKLLGIFFVGLLAFVLVGCKKNDHFYDGTFTAFEVSENYGEPQITWVSVVIEKGKIKKYFIDERQTKDGIWNEKTKKELLDDYGMKPVSPIKKEWYEQAETIELFFLKQGPEKLSLNDKGYVDNLAGATIIADNYKRIALKALKNAKEGIYTALEVSLNYGFPQVTWVDAHVKNDKIVKYVIDELQSTKDGWNYHTKKELLDDYGMKPVSPIQKEWFEQAEVIEKYFLEHGPANIPLNNDGYVDGVTGATMIATGYRRLAVDLNNYINKENLVNGKIAAKEEPVIKLPTEFNYDGIFTAFNVSLSYGKPQITWVSVEIVNGEIASYLIDERQTTDNVWNEKTKKELLYDYGMKPVSPIDKEWFEQAEVIENYFLEHGPDKLPLDDSGYVDGVTGATMIADSYQKLAIEALFKAADGIYTAFDVSLNYGAPQVTWVNVHVEEGNIVKYYIDERQTKDGVWNEKTKKELLYDYGMKPVSPIQKEWFEQAEVIEAYFLEHGPADIPLNEAGYVDGVTGATMIADSYRDLALLASSYIK